MLAFNQLEIMKLKLGPVWGNEKSIIKVYFFQLFRYRRKIIIYILL